MLKKSRNYGIDILRIALAFMVLVLHCYAGATGQVAKYSTQIPWRWIAHTIVLLCGPAVNCYVLISAIFSYRQCKSISQTAHSVIHLWFTVLFYSVLGYVLVSIFKQEFHVFDFIKRFFPIIRGKWWFFTVYFVITLCAPFFVKLSDAISRREHTILLLILLTSCSIAPVFVFWEGQLGTNYGYSFLWFAVLYLSGIYISKYIYTSEKKSITIFIVSLVIYVALALTSYILSAIIGRIGIQLQLSHYSCIITYAQSVVLVWGFMHLPVGAKLKKPILMISSLSMASYLFHCQEDIESILWAGLKLWRFANSVYIIPVIFGTVSIIFMVSVAIERVRITMSKKFGFEEKVSSWIIAKSKGILEKIEGV